MQEICGNIWDYGQSAIVAITTNGKVGRSGKVAMGRGVAAQAALLYPELPCVLARCVNEGGNHVHYLGNGIVSFPVEHSPFEIPDIRLIGRSAAELVAMADDRHWRFIVVPRPGCGGGGLSWKEVRPILAACFDDRFSVICAPGAG